MPRVFALSALLLLAGCSRAKQAPAMDGSAPTTPMASGARATDAAAPAPPEDEARRVVALWSEALDRHDLAALDRLYTPRVNFYGKDLPKSAVVAMKKRVLGSTSTFHQSIVGSIEVTRNGDAFTATFQKHSGSSRMSDVKASLVIVGGQVREESDAASEAHAKDARRETCEGTASAVVVDLPEVKKQGPVMGGLGPIDNDDGGFSAAFGIHHPDRFEAQVWYTVDAVGTLSVTVLGEDIAIPVAAKSKVERACKPAP
jgi:hypothetical protein